MKILKRIYRLLQADERKKLIKMAVTVCLLALLNFVSLAALFPVLYFLLEKGGKNEAALFFCMLHKHAHHTLSEPVPAFLLQTAELFVILILLQPWTALYP